MKLSRIVMALSVCGFLVGPALPAPQASAADPNSSEQMMKEGLTQLMEALRLFVAKIPLYETPEILENGDIIIRRKNPPPSEEEDGDDSASQPEFDKTNA